MTDAVVPDLHVIHEELGPSALGMDVAPAADPKRHCRSSPARVTCLYANTLFGEPARLPPELVDVGLDETPRLEQRQRAVATAMDAVLGW